MRKKVIAVALMGIPGSGKSQLVALLAEQLHWPVIDRDLIPRERFDEIEKARATDAAFEQIAAHLAAARSCIVDGMTFAQTGQRDRLRELAREAGARAVLLWLDCPVEVAIARVTAQEEHPAGDRNANLVRDVARRFAPPDGDVVRLDARLPTEELLLLVGAALQEGL